MGSPARRAHGRESSGVLHNRSWPAAPAVNLLVAHWAVMGVTALILAAPGTAMGYGLWRRLPDIAGMTGFPIAGMALGFGAVVVVVGVVIAHSIRPLGDWQYGFILFGTMTWLAAWIIKSVLTEE